MRRAPFTKLFLALALGATAVSLSAADLPDPTKEDFTGVANAIASMLQSGHSSSFADEFAPSLVDWRAAVPTNQAVTTNEVNSPEWRTTLAQQRLRLAQSAKLMGNKLFALKVDLSKVRLTAKVVPPESFSAAHFPVQPDGSSLVAADKIDFVFSAEPLPDTEGAEVLRGDYVVRMTHLLKFPDGWRCAGDVQWVALPTTVADEQTQRDMAIEAKANSAGELAENDDPALANLGERLVQFIRARDVAVFEKDVTLPLAGMKQFMKTMSSTGRKMPSDPEIQAEWEKQSKGFVAPAKALVALMEQEGVDLKNAEIKVKQVALQRTAARLASGSLEGMSGAGLQVEFSVQSTASSKTGKSLTGDYVVTADQTLRIGGRWYVLRGVRFGSFPAGVVDEKTLALLKREAVAPEANYLPVGSIAPDIEFVRLSDEQKMKLSDLRGKVVILDFWATWCGPCQAPMAKLQKYREENPDWKDRVTVLALSVDETLQAARRHMQKRGWTNTLSTWVGDSGGDQTFQVEGIPTCYVIDADGKIIDAGHPAAMHTPDTVNRLLKGK